MRTLKLSLLSLSLVAGLSSAAAAQTVTFEDAGTVLGFLSNGYAGRNWSNAAVADPSYLMLGSGPSGGGNVVSGTHILLNGGGQAMGISGGTFNLLNGKFAAAWTNGLNLNVKGYSAGNLLYNQSYVLDWSTPQSLMLNLMGVDNVTFSSFGGAVDQLFPEGSNQSFVADDLEFSTGGRSFRQAAVVDVVPEPMTVSLMAAGLLVLGGAQARRRRTSQAR